MERRRRSIRLAGYEYILCGAYFVTICTQARDHLFGEVVNGVMVLTNLVSYSDTYWLRTAGDGRLPPAYEFVVMPNHVHGIVWLPARPTSAPWPIAVGTRRPFSQEDIASLSSRDWSRGHSDQTDASPLQHHDEGLRSAVGNQRRSLGTLVGAFKSMATRKINILRGTPGLPVWQRGYHERIIRNEGELARVRQYILNNPAHWSEDPNNAEAA